MLLSSISLKFTFWLFSILRSRSLDAWYYVYISDIFPILLIFTVQFIILKHQTINYSFFFNFRLIKSFWDLTFFAISLITFLCSSLFILFYSRISASLSLSSSNSFFCLFRLLSSFLSSSSFFCFIYSLTFFKVRTTRSNSNYSETLAKFLRTFVCFSRFSTAYFFNWQLSSFMSSYYFFLKCTALFFALFSFAVWAFSSWMSRYFWSIHIFYKRYWYPTFLRLIFSTHYFSSIWAIIFFIFSLSIFLFIIFAIAFSYSSSNSKCLSGLLATQY